MNSLSHYFLEQQHPSPYRKLGVLMPDLIYQFNRKLRRNIFDHGIPENYEEAQIFDGIKRHYLADAIFHQSEFFVHYTRVIHSEIKRLPLPSVKFRSYFLAHVFLEMLLDRVLAQHNPDLTVRIYNDLRSANPEVAASYFLRIGKTGVFSEFFNNFSRILNARHLHFLGDNEMFVKALLRVYFRINPAYPSREEAKILMALTEKLETEHRYKLLGIFEVMGNHPAYA